MTELARLLKMDNQPPVLKLLAALSLTIVGGTLLFYLFVWAGSFLFSVSFEEMFSTPGPDASTEQIGIIRFVQSVQQISLFIIPSFIIIKLISKKGESFTGIDIFPRISDIIPVLFLALLIIPITTFLGYLNSGIDLPAWLAGTEKWIGEMEKQADLLTGYLVNSSDVPTLLLNLAIMAVIPAIGEELFFRGLLQRLLGELIKSPHLAIWLVSIVFSSIHMQFYGFFPRLLLGLIFGYLYFWSRNIWMPIIMHFVNNAVPVILSFRSGTPEIAGSGREIYLKEIPPPVIQMILVALILWYLRRSFAERYRPDA